MLFLIQKRRTETRFLAIFQDIAMLFARMGLKDKDTRVFMTCMGASDEGMFTHEIVKKTKIKRSTVDLILKRLLEQSFITRIRIGSRYKYFPESLETLLFKQEQIADDFKTLIPLIKKFGGSGGETQIRFFEGAQGIRKAYEAVLLSLKFAEGDGRALISFSSGSHIIKVFSNIQRAFIDKRIRLKIPYHVIAPDSSKTVKEWTDDKQALRYAKFIDQSKFPFRVTLEIYADSLMIISPTKPTGAIIIRNERLADSMRSLFSLVWNLLPD